jgi:probable rRNA maturation factor
VVVDDATMQQLNARYLQHDYPTDVLSFPLERSPTSLEGEIIVSAETATRESHRFGWTPAEEILLYLVHGTLHLIGYDDQTEEESRAMREKERTYLVRAGQDPSGVESRSN